MKISILLRLYFISQLLCPSISFAQAPVWMSGFPQVLPHFSGSEDPVTKEYQDNISVTVKANQPGTAYFVTYQTTPSTAPTGQQIVDYVTGTAPSGVIRKGSIAMPAAETVYRTVAYDLAKSSSGYRTYVVVKNTSNVLSTVKSALTRLKQSGKHLNYYYLEYVPLGYDPGNTTKHPLIIFLHGIGETGSSITSLGDVVVNGPPKEIQNGQEFDFIILSPQSTFPWDIPKLDEFLTQVKTRYNGKIDLNRIYLTGLSMGGYGTWKYAITHPEKLAAIVPISGGAEGLKSQAADKLKEMPIWAFHDDPDGVVPTYHTRDLETLITGAAGYTGKMRTTYFHNRRSGSPYKMHSIWGAAYSNNPSPSSTTDRTVEENPSPAADGMTVYSWMLQHRLNAPNRAPIVNAGSNQSTTQNSLTIHGYVVDNDLNINASTINWTKVGGPTATLSQSKTVISLAETEATLTITNMNTSGDYTFRLTASDNAGLSHYDEVVIKVSGTSNVSPTVSITDPDNNDSFASPATITITATASDSDGSISKVEFYNGDDLLGSDSSSPYSFVWDNILPGNYALRAHATDDDNAVTISAAVNISVTGGSCANTGSIVREYWNNVSGNTVGEIPINDEPSGTQSLQLFEGPTNVGTNYGARIRGYICPPATGLYTFWIASNDHSQLSLSTNADPGSRRVIASIVGATTPRQWDKYTSQKSDPIMLTAGQKYYIEALHKQGAGSDNLAVAWELPNGTFQGPIPGVHLSPFSLDNTGPSVSITNPSDNATFSAPASITIQATAADIDGTIARVEFFRGTTKLGEDFSSPYSFAWSNVAAGSYVLTAKAYDNDGAVTTSGPIDITVSGACAGTGQILRQYWNGISGNAVTSTPESTAPTGSQLLTSFEAPENVGTNYEARIKGYICAPTTGTYFFWIASNDYSQLWLSTDDSPANLRSTPIASVTGATNPREWTKFTSQKSAGITLTGGQRYYIEARHKQGAGTDHVAVGWELPGGTQERPIPGNRLIPFETDNALPSVSLTNPGDEQVFSGPASITIQASASDSDGSITKVEFYNGSTEIGEDLSTPYSMTWSNVQAGNYTLTAKAFDNDGGVSTSSAVNVIVTSQCAGSGEILREYWTSIQGNTVDEIPITTQPDGTELLTSFQGPSNIGTNYGARIRGYICAPSTGYYTFWISSNDHSELYLSTDQNPANIGEAPIAYVIGATDPLQWTKFTTQESTPIMLTAGQSYYIEARHKQGIGTDHVAVGWELPNATLERPIPGNRLTPYEDGSSARMSSSGTKGEESEMEMVTVEESAEQTFAVYPNPTTHVMHVKGFREPASVRVYNGQGILIFETHVDDITNTVQLNTQQYTPGIYYLVVQGDLYMERKKFIKDR